MPPETKPTAGEIATYLLLGALLGGLLTWLAVKDDDSDPDRPPIIVRNGSVIVGETGSDHGELT